MIFERSLQKLTNLGSPQNLICGVSGRTDCYGAKVFARLQLKRAILRPDNLYWTGF